VIPRRGGVARRVAALASLCAAGAACAAGLAPLAGRGAEPAAPWRWAGLPQQTLPATRYSVVELDATRVLRVEADRSYGNLVHDLPAGTQAGSLAWRWRVDRPTVGADLTRRSGDDAALKVCAMFDMPASQVPFVERQMQRMAQARSADKLPAATLCFVWDEALPEGTVIVNPYTRRVRSIVIQGVRGRWSEERHELAAAFLRAFGDEAQTVPPLIAIVVSADGDNTGSHSLAYLDALRLTPP
jgi:hypothetical protein